MSTYSRFPSGASVEQVKKDAKLLSRSEGIPLHAALNKAAARHGIAKPWAKVLEQLALVGEADPFIVFNLESAGQVVEFGLTVDRPIGVIVGATGTGKSVLASLLCESHLTLGTTALHFVSPDGVTSDLAGKLLHKMVTRHSDRAGITIRDAGAPFSKNVARDVTPIATPAAIPVVAGDLMLVDEPYRAITAPPITWTTKTLALGVGVLLVVQSAQEIAFLRQARISFVLAAESYRQFTLQTHSGPAWHIEVEDASARSRS